MDAELGDLDEFSRGLIASVADVAMVVDASGIVTDVWLGATFERSDGWQSLVGQPWSETVLPDSRVKAEELVRNAFEEDAAGERREVNQAIEGGGVVTLSASAVRFDDERVVIAGRDLSPVASMQQRLVSAQQSMDLEYRRLRRAGTAYRVLFRVCLDAVLVVRDSDHEIIEANPAAAALLGAPVESVRGQKLEDVFAAGSRDELFTLFGALEAGASPEIDITPAGREDLKVSASASRFRQTGTLLMLFRFWPTDRGQAPELHTRRSRMMAVLEAMPDAFVVTDAELRVLSANAAYCELVQRSTEQTVAGFHLGRWLGRPGVDLKIISASLRENGVLRDFSTVIRGEYGQTQEALVTGVAAMDGDLPCMGFSIRTVETRVIESDSGSLLPRSADRLRSLVGRVSLKDIVQESTDLVEKLCIKAALEVSGNNRAAAAALLGLSRQSLYSKLRRYSIGD
ncbi:MAG: transcriptional regulator PpsR [Myxococcota bacterium]